MWPLAGTLTGAEGTATLAKSFFLAAAHAQQQAGNTQEKKDWSKH